MDTFDVEYVLFWTHLILDDGFLSFLKKQFANSVFFVALCSCSL